MQRAPRPPITDTVSEQRFYAKARLSLLFCRRAGNCRSVRPQARRRERRGSDKRSSRSKPDMGTPSPPLDFLILKNRKPIHHQILKFSETETRVSID